MKHEENLELGAYVKAWVALHIFPKERFSELCHIRGSSGVTLSEVFRWVKIFQGVSV